MVMVKTTLEKSQAPYLQVTVCHVGWGLIVQGVTPATPRIAPPEHLDPPLVPSLSNHVPTALLALTRTRQEPMNAECALLIHSQAHLVPPRVLLVEMATRYQPPAPTSVMHVTLAGLGIPLSANLARSVHLAICQAQVRVSW